MPNELPAYLIALFDEKLARGDSLTEFEHEGVCYRRLDRDFQGGLVEYVTTSIEKSQIPFFAHSYDYIPKSFLPVRKYFFKPDQEYATAFYVSIDMIEQANSAVDPARDMAVKFLERTLKPRKTSLTQ